jgi:hypothetical protein
MIAEGDTEVDENKQKPQYLNCGFIKCAVLKLHFTPQEIVARD